MNKKIIKLIFFTCLINKTFWAMDRGPAPTNGPLTVELPLIGKVDMAKAFQSIGEAVGEVAESMGKHFESEENRVTRDKGFLEIRLADLERNYGRRLLGEDDKKYYLKEKADLQKKIDVCDEKLERIKEDRAEWDKSSRELVTKGVGGLLDTFNLKMQGEEMRKNERAKQREINQGLKDKAVASINTFFDRVKDPKTGVAIVGAFGGLVGTYYLSKLLFRYIESRMNKPKLIRETSKHDWKYAVTNIFGKKEERENLDEVILTEELSKKLKLLADEVRTAQANNLPYRHSLFYGLPGTGKTMFAKKLAKYSGMDYAIMSGADFAQFKNGEGITELHKLFDWAEKSSTGLLIFIDEADSFLRDRRVLSNNEERNLLNAFLSRSGASSNKYMFVFATNYEDELDPAVLSRINKKINFPMPGLIERNKIINLYFDKYIVNDVHFIKKNGKKYKLKIEISNDIDQEFFNSMAIRTDGFSGRELEQLISETHVKSYSVGNGFLTKELIEDVLKDKKVEHDHDMVCANYQRERMQKELGINQVSMNSDSK